MLGVSPNRAPAWRGDVDGLRIWQDWRVRAIGAVGSALRSHRRGHRFESGIAHNSWQRETAAHRRLQRAGATELGEDSRRKQHRVRGAIGESRQPGRGKQLVVQIQKFGREQRPGTVPVGLYSGFSATSAPCPVARPPFPVLFFAFDSACRSPRPLLPPPPLSTLA